MAAALAVLGGFFIWRDRAAGPYLLALALGFAALGIALPRLLVPVERVWLALAERLGRVMNTVLLTVFYFLALTPVAWLLRRFGRDRLELRSRRRHSYWVRRAPQAREPRYDRPF